MKNGLIQIVATLAKLDAEVIYYDGFQAILDRIEECVIKTQYYSRSENCVIAAEPGMGKTFIAELIQRQMASEFIIDGECEVTTVPAFYIEVPAQATPLEMAATMLIALGEPAPIRGDLVQRTHRLITKLERCKIKLVFMDEFQHMMTQTKSRYLLSAGVIEWVKQLANASKVTYCLLGSAEFLPYLMENSHTRKRFADVLHMKPLTLPTQEDIGTFKPYYLAYSELVKGHFEGITLPDAYDDHFIRQLWVATNGIPKFISLLVKTAVQFCVLEGKTEVTTEHFSDTWDRHRDSGISASFKNPFTLNSRGLAMSVKESANV